jgi:hypothetical protein
MDAGSDAGSDPCGTLSAIWSRCAANPLAEAGYRQSDGRYELAIGDPDVMYDPAARLWRAWWSTTLSSTYPAPPNSQLGIKYADSPDGVSWNIQPALTIVSRPNTSDWDTLKCETPSVLELPTNPPDRRWLLYYSGAGIMGTVNGATIPWYQIGLAFSSDGKSFTRLPAAESPYAGQQTPYGNVEGLILLGRDAFPGVPGVADGLVADPEAVFDGTTVHLFFSSLAVDPDGGPLAFGIGHATSLDGVHFTAAMDNAIPVLYGGRGPSLVQDANGGWEMFFQRDSAADLMQVPSSFNPQLGIWRATSPDLSSWTVPSASRELEWDGTYVTERYGWISAGDMTLVNGEYRYYYSAFSALAPPSNQWVVPLQGNQYATSLDVLDMSRRQ